MEPQKSSLIYLIKRSIFRLYKFLLNIFFKLTPFFKSANKLAVNFAERIHLVYKSKTKFGDILFSIPNGLTLWRAETFLTKEPDTIEWMNSFQKNDILFDVGANVGLYSLYAAKKGSKVFAFEAESQNYALLNRNVYLNKLDDNLKAYNIAIASATKVDVLYVNEMTIGGALNNFGDNIDLNKKKFNQSYKQGMLAISIDELIEKYLFPVPQHLKIDVDGLEYEIIQGAKSTLANPKLKSVLIELNTSLECDIEVIKTLENLGFNCTSKLQPPFCVGSKFENIFNYVFVRA